MKRLKNKTAKAIQQLETIRQDLFYQSLPDANRNDLKAAHNALQTFYQNLPEGKNK